MREEVNSAQSDRNEDLAESEREIVREILAMRRNVSCSARSRVKVGTGSKGCVTVILGHVPTDSKPEGGAKHGND